MDLSNTQLALAVTVLRKLAHRGDAGAMLTVPEEIQADQQKAVQRLHAMGMIRPDGLLWKITDLGVTKYGQINKFLGTMFDFDMGERMARVTTKP